MPEGWVVTENRALAQRPHLFGLPVGYASLLIMTVLFVTLTLEYVAAGLYLLGFGLLAGKLVTFYDFYAWHLAAKNLTLPRILRP